MHVRSILIRSIACLSVVVCVTALCSRGVTFDGNRSKAAWVRISPDGTNIAAVNWEERKLQLWDVEHRRKRMSLRYRDDHSLKIAFTSDGRRLAYSDEGPTIHISDVTTGADWATFQVEAEGTCSLAFSPDSRLLASGGKDATIRLWDVATGHQQAVLQGNSEAIRELVFSPDGKTLASGSRDGIVKLWDVAAGKELLTLAHDSEYELICALAFSPDGKTLASAGWYATFKLWDVSTGENLFLEHPKWLGEHSGAYIQYIAFSPDGKTLAAGTSEVIGVWNLTSARCLVSYGWKQRPFDWSVGGLLDGFAVTDDSDARIVRSVWFSPEGKLFALGLDGGSVMMWQVTAFPIWWFSILCGLSAGILFLAILAGLRAALRPLLTTTTPATGRRAGPPPEKKTWSMASH